MTENAEEKKAPAESEPTKAAEGAQAPPAEGAADAKATAAEKEEKIEGLDADVKQVGPCKVEVKVRVPIEAIKKESAKAFDELSMNATIPGFRKGHAPRKLVERHHQEAVLDDVKRLMTARSWQQVTKEHDIKPIGDPDLADDKIQYDAEKGLSYELALEVMPVFDVKDYKGIELAQPSTEVTGEEVEKTLENLRKRNAVLEPVEGGTTKQDDVPVVDCDIKVGAQVVQSVSDQEISLNPDNWLRGLDPELWKDLLGKKAGESATKTVTLPKTYAKEEFREKEAQVTVTLKDI